MKEKCEKVKEEGKIEEKRFEMIGTTIFPSVLLHSSSALSSIAPLCYIKLIKTGSIIQKSIGKQS